MKLSFNNRTKALEKALKTKKLSDLHQKWPNSKGQILKALIILENAGNLYDVMQFKMFRPHAMYKDGKYPYECFSIAPAGRMTIRLVSEDADGKKLKVLDYKSPCAHVLEVGEHYGD